MNVKLNDTVMVITGRKSDVGRTGKVIATSPKNGTVTVAGINVRKKTKKARKATDVSQIVDMECPIDASNVMVVCPSCGAPTRVHHGVVDGKKVRVCKCGAVLDTAYAGKGGKGKPEAKPQPKRTRKRTKKTDGASENAE